MEQREVIAPKELWATADQRRDSIRECGAVLTRAEADLGSVVHDVAKLIDERRGDWPNPAHVLIGRQLMQASQVHALLRRAETLLNEIENDFWRLRAEDERR